MKSTFKKIIIILFAILSFNSIKSQNVITIGNENYNQWVLSNNTCYGCGSFYVMVVNNPTPIKGYYYYDIYFWGNSFYSNGYAANSYIKFIDIYGNDHRGINIPILNFQYIVVPPKSYTFDGYFYVGYVYSLSSTQRIQITWSTVNPW
jgi:hypothetical protein